jgi:hypothetical protein
VITFKKVESDILGAFTITLPLLALFFARALDGITGETYRLRTHILQT